ncbi:DOMON domain-containing protein [Flagellimonas meridianipacifica]|uniref:DOMON domain-containing protein n=1 Tax=Flagellimonas meridianipacifica TaxID=1080225 RepID=A0A2T0MJV9_9FLAO|nr:DOMON domain-containing protein [Allomuricauda pacifica]PRX57861.1 DOMON domain-containing protein [Allomuricauda pacifica]
MNYKSFASVFLVLLCCSLSFAQQVKVNQMDISWKFEDNAITFTASAPDDGWIALGFNSKNDIVGSNLIMVNVVDGKVNTEDLFVLGVGNPKPVNQLGSQSQVMGASGKESSEKTWVSFSLPTKAFDKYHMDLKKGDTIWLICAYSMEDEFDHHSRMRKHVEVEL